MQRILQILLFANLLLNAAWAVSAQNLPNYHIQHYDTQDGLSNNWVSALEEDEYGYLWVGTQYGLNRFDGLGFLTYTDRAGQKGLSGNWVRSLYHTSEQKLWIGTFGGGLSSLDILTNSFEQLAIHKQFENSTILDILPKNEEETFIATANGAYLAEASGAVILLASGSINNVRLLQPNVLLLATRQGLRIKTADQQQDTVLFDHKWTGSLLSLSTDSTLLVVQDQLVLLTSTNGRWEATEMNIEVPIHPLFWHTPFLFKDSKQQIWLPGKDKLWCLSANLKQRYSYPLADILPYHPKELPSLNCMLEDRNGVMWIGTNQGLLQLSPVKPFSHPLLTETQRRLPNVRGIVSQGQDYLFTSAEGVYYWSPPYGEPTLFTDAPLISPFKNQAGDVYAILQQATNWQLVTVNLNDKIFSPVPCLPLSAARWKIIKEDQRGRLWISDWGNLQCLDPKTGYCFRVELRTDKGVPLFLQAVDILVDKSDRLWIACQSKGLFQIQQISQYEDGDQLLYHQYQRDDSTRNQISSSIVQALHEDGDGQIWVGTDGGLNLYLEEVDGFKYWLRSHTMPDDKILDIESDDSGKLWLSTVSHGILAFNPTTEQFANYTSKDGLYADDMLIGSGYKEEEGRIWMGTPNGLQSFLPAQIYEEEPPADTLIWQQLDIHRQDTTLQLFFPTQGQHQEDPLIVRHDDHNLSLSFAWLNFRHAGRQQYRYRLGGIHSDWLPAPANGLVSLSQLPAGRYTLQVAALTAGEQVEAFAPLIYLRVLPPWYQTPLAYVIYTILALGIAYFAYHTQLSRKLAAVEREQAEALVASKMRFFRQIAHEFRSPLTLVFGAVEQIKQRLRKENQSNVQPQLDQLQEQAEYLTRQVDEILELAKLQADRSPLQLETADFVRYQRFLLQSYSSLAEAKKISLQFHTELPSLTFPFDADKWRKITGNLISNALKFTPTGGQITLNLAVSTAPEQDILLFSLRDNGQGISPNLRKHLFEPFTQGNEQPEGGSGIGLALTKALVEQHGGVIAVNSVLGQGSRFDIRLPFQAVLTSSETGCSLPNSEELPLVLLAEDHTAVRNYIRECLVDIYKIQEAENGTEAWKICLEELPDLVISDIMMPGGSGLELSRRIRDNERTNHIPLILLTGKSDQQDRMAGLRAGADVYLTKPFHREELLLRIQGLLDTRKRLQQKYQSGDFTVQSTTQTSDTFMQQVVAIINEEIDNDSFSVEALAQQLHLSRVQLFRKIKALTDFTPTLLIRQVRLRHAHHLLQNTEHTISEIAYACGFKDPAYFSRVYKDQFGQSPSEGRGE